MPPFPIYCSTPTCKNVATCKIAARWSDGVSSELKTYGLVCNECLPAWYQRAQEKRRACRLGAGETIDEPGVFRLERGQRDKVLVRLDDLENTLRASLGKDTRPNP